jgi:hypothetical protein
MAAGQLSPIPVVSATAVGAPSKGVSHTRWESSFPRNDVSPVPRDPARALQGIIDSARRTKCSCPFAAVTGSARGDAEPEGRVFAFASYVAALDFEEAAASDLAATAQPAAA